MRLGIKVGSSSLVDRRGDLQHGAFEHISSEINQAIAIGHHVTLTTSGFAAAGNGHYAAGRRRIHAAWREHLGDAFAGVHLVGRMGLGRSATMVDDAMNNGKVLVTNGFEGDECFGSNDQLAATLACRLKLDRLVLLGEKSGICRDVDDDGSVIESVDVRNMSAIQQYIGQQSMFGTGGAQDKLVAAGIAAESGIVTHYAHWSEGFDAVLAGQVGTTFEVGHD